LKFKTSIVNRISFWFILSTTTLAVSSIFIFYLSLEKTLEKENKNVASERMQALHSILDRKQDPLVSAKRRIESEWATISFERIYVRLRTLDGQVLSISPNTPSEVIDEIFQKKPIEHRLKRKTSSTGEIYLAASEPLTISQGQTQLYADLAFDLTPEESVLQQLRFRLIMIVGVVIIASFVFGRRLAIASLQPVQDIAQRASAIRSTNLHERIETIGLPSELRLLVDTFNQMLDRLSDSFSRMSQFSSDIAHELRTPVNNTRGEIEVTLAKDRSPEEYREVLSSCLEELERISKITDSLLFIAKAENPVTQLPRERCNLSEELEKIAEFYETTAIESNVSIIVNSEKTIELEVNRTLFQRAIGNLISNALAHTPRGGKVSIRGSRLGEYASIEVADTGEGIAPEHLSRIFDRFYRADPSRSNATGSTGSAGFGLGLAIVQGIIHLHGGKVEVTSTPGKGTSVTLKFPIDLTSLG
jgi:two-component system, OmpR family, heavy metal sensor histidine kinase CusS